MIPLFFGIQIPAASLRLVVPREDNSADVLFSSPLLLRMASPDFSMNIYQSYDTLNSFV